MHEQVKANVDRCFIKQGTKKEKLFEKWEQRAILEGNWGTRNPLPP